MDVSFDEREMLMEAEPETFHITAHYKDYPSVLARHGEPASRLVPQLPGAPLAQDRPEEAGEGVGGGENPLPRQHGGEGRVKGRRCRAAR